MNLLKIEISLQHEAVRFVHLHFSGLVTETMICVST